MQKNPPLQLNLLKTLLYAMFSVFITGSVLASEPDTLFRSEEIIKIELRSDFTAIQNDRAENPVAHDGEVIYLTSSGEAKKLSVKITVRGHFRRDPVHCIRFIVIFRLCISILRKVKIKIHFSVIRID